MTLLVHVMKALIPVMVDTKIALCHFIASDTLLHSEVHGEPLQYQTSMCKKKKLTQVPLFQEYSPNCQHWIWSCIVIRYKDKYGSQNHYSLSKKVCVDNGFPLSISLFHLCMQTYRGWMILALFQPSSGWIICILNMIHLLFRAI